MEKTYYCGKCGYRLYERTEQVAPCPECGQVIDLDDSQTYSCIPLGFVDHAERFLKRYGHAMSSGVLFLSFGLRGWQSGDPFDISLAGAMLIGAGAHFIWALCHPVGAFGRADGFLKRYGRALLTLTLAVPFFVIACVTKDVLFFAVAGVALVAGLGMFIAARVCKEES